MKNMLRRCFCTAVVLAMLLSFAVPAFATGTFNAGVTIRNQGDTITVTLAEENDAFFAAQSPRLSIVCDYQNAVVTRNGETVESTLKDGMISFFVKAGGTYVISKTTSDDDGNDGVEDDSESVCSHPDENGDKICDLCHCNLTVELVGAVVGLKDSIHMEIYSVLPEDVRSDESAYLQIVRPGKTEPEKIPVADAVANGSYYKFSAEFSAKEMTDEITLQMVYEDGTVGPAYSYSLRTYADAILDETNGYPETARKMVKAMLFYGAYAQKHFNYQTENLANAGLSMDAFDLSSVTAETLKSYADGKQEGTKNVIPVGSSLVLKSETILRVFFRVDASVLNQLSITCGNQELKLHTSGSYYYVDITGIAAKDLGTDVTIEINDGTKATISVNPMSYCYAVLANPDSYQQSLCDIVKALFLYHQNAKDYFNAQGD